MPVTMDGIDYPSARQAFMALGFSQAQRKEPRKELRRTGKVKITLAGRTHVDQEVRTMSNRPRNWRA